MLKWGVTRGEEATVKAERGVIDGVRVQRGVFKDRLIFATRNLQLLKAIPGPHVNEVVLRTKKRHRIEVGAFMEKVLAWKAGKAA